MADRVATPAQSQAQDLRRVIGLAGGTALIVGITSSPFITLGND